MKTNEPGSPNPLNDPAFTAFALGEMTEGNQRDWNQILEDTPALAPEQLALERLAGALTHSLLAGTVSEGLTFAQRKEIFAELARNARHRPAPRVWIPLAAAAALAALFVVVSLVTKTSRTQLASSDNGEAGVVHISVKAEPNREAASKFMVQVDRTLVVPAWETLQPNHFIDPRLPLFADPGTRMTESGFPALEPEPALDADFWNFPGSRPLPPL